jgi:hypothetical protein
MKSKNIKKDVAIYENLHYNKSKNFVMEVKKI